MRLELSLACCDYDRTRAIFDGRVRVDGCELVATALEPEEAFHRAFKYEEFDVSELSLSSYTVQVARGEHRYAAIPAFVSRVFRHSGIYVRTDRGIARPQDLKGRTLGLPEYQMTANVWIRGMLQDEYGVRPSDVRWRNGGLEQPGREERTKLSLPPEIDLKAIAPGATLSAMLEAGELDGVLAARPPSCFTRGAPHVGRLFPDSRKAEQDYFRRTRIFPAMHVVGIRKALLAAHPWLAVNVMKAFVQAKALCWHELGQIGHLYNSLPWGVADFADARALMGEDYWSYGLEPNRHVLEAFTRYHHEQGLSPRKVSPEEMFAPAACDLSRI
ncbi:MAG: ABC transporter substrate-binding protein [Betaproteobacteria bacterium]|nr:MAG: ABC transporter substrate-binding protein [Betaproteobacteria bacterium]